MRCPRTGGGNDCFQIPISLESLHKRRCLISSSIPGAGGFPSHKQTGPTQLSLRQPCTSRNEPKLPCSDRIIEQRIAKVYIGVLDPNERVHGSGELRLRDAGIQIGRFDSDLMPIIEELNRHFSRQHRARSRLERTASETHDPVGEGETGPNGYRIGYTQEGDKAEFIPDEENPGKEWALILRRNDKAILAEYQLLWDKVWWNRHQVWVEKIRNGEETLRPEQEEVFRQAESAARRIEAKYGLENLGWDDFQWVS